MPKITNTNIHDQTIGRLDDASSDVTLRDLEKCIGNKNPLGRQFYRLIARVQGKGIVNDSNVKALLEKLHESPQAGRIRTLYTQSSTLSNSSSKSASTSLWTRFKNGCATLLGHGTNKTAKQTLQLLNNWDSQLPRSTTSTPATPPNRRVRFAHLTKVRSTDQLGNQPRDSVGRAKRREHSVLDSDSKATDAEKDLIAFSEGKLSRVGSEFRILSKKRSRQARNKAIDEALANGTPRLTMQSVFTLVMRFLPKDLDSEAQARLLDLFTNSIEQNAEELETLPKEQAVHRMRELLTTAVSSGNRLVDPLDFEEFAALHLDDMPSIDSGNTVMAYEIAANRESSFPQIKQWVDKVPGYRDWARNSRLQILTSYIELAEARKEDPPNPEKIQEAQKAYDATQATIDSEKGPWMERYRAVIGDEQITLVYVSEEQRTQINEKLNNLVRPDQAIGGALWEILQNR